MLGISSQRIYGISGSVLSWFGSYLSGRTQTVVINKVNSKPASVRFGVPQGFVLGPILFILYMKPLSSLIHCHSISNQSFADILILTVQIRYMILSLARSLALLRAIPCSSSPLATCPLQNRIQTIYSLPRFLKFFSSLHV